VIGLLLAAFSLSAFGAVVVVVVTVLTVGVGAAGIFMQRRNAAIIEALKNELALSDRARGEQEATIQTLKIDRDKNRNEIEHLKTEVARLNEMVTQAAKVDALRGDVEAGFKEVLGRLPANAA
jgi:hypothetical protein